MRIDIVKLTAGIVATMLGAVSAQADAGRPPALAQQSVESAPKAERRYCVVDSATGSRIPLKVCQTRKDWLARGFDPLAPKD